MKRHLTLSTTSQHARNQSRTAETVAARIHAVGGDGNLAEPAHARPHLTAAGARVWKHTLILTGKLDSRSIPELEEEIECLCQEGVTLLTLDLRQLDAIDSTGITVIALRGAVCKRRGHDFAVIPGSRVISSALVEAGATDLLTPEPNASVVRRFPGRSSHRAVSARSTAMIQHLD